MPADFTSQDTARTNLANLFGFATGAGTRLKTFLDTMFGAANPFGTAATRNTNASYGLPVLNSNRDVGWGSLPGATDTKGAVAYGDATDPNEELSLVGISYPRAVSATSAREFFAQFQNSVTLTNLNVSQIELRNYGPDNAQRTALVLPEYACMVIIAANGGHPDIVNRNLDTYRNSIPQDGDDINILSGTQTILTIPGGAAPSLLQYLQVR